MKTQAIGWHFFDWGCGIGGRGGQFIIYIWVSMILNVVSTIGWLSRSLDTVQVYSLSSFGATLFWVGLLRVRGKVLPGGIFRESFAHEYFDKRTLYLEI